MSWVHPIGCLVQVPSLALFAPIKSSKIADQNKKVVYHPVDHMPIQKRDGKTQPGHKTQNITLLRHSVVS